MTLSQVCKNECDTTFYGDDGDYEERDADQCSHDQVHLNGVTFPGKENAHGATKVFNAVYCRRLIPTGLFFLPCLFQYCQNCRFARGKPVGI